MNQAIKDLMREANKRLNSIEEKIALNHDLGPPETKDQQIARLTQIIKDLEKQLKELTKKL